MGSVIRHRLPAVNAEYSGTREQLIRQTSYRRMIADDSQRRSRLLGSSRQQRLASHHRVDSFEYFSSLAQRVLCLGG